MKQYIVELPIRTIHLELLDKEPTPLEALGLPAYIELHNELWEVKQLAEKYREEVDEMESMVKKIAVAYNAMEDEAKKYGRFAGFSDEEAQRFFPADVTTVTLKIGHIQSLINNYATVAEEYNHSRENNVSIYSETEIKRDKFDESLSYFCKNYFSPILKAWEEVQVDTVSLDRDMNEFRETCTEVYDIYDQLIDKWNELCEEAKEIDRRLKILNPHIKCLSDSINASRFTNDNFELN